MKVCAIHTAYQQPGGEDAVFAAETALLEAHGHEVTRYTASNWELEGVGGLALARATVWNDEHYHAVRQHLRETRPDVAHVHNTFPLLSPAVLHAARAERVPVVQTLHNYRLLCVNSLLFRDGRPCEDCVTRRSKWPGVVHACYRGSTLASGAVATMLNVHRLRGTWAETVDVFVALTEFSRGRFLAGGLDPEQVVVKPNFLDPDPGPGAHQGGYALFVGRLSEEKGLDTLLTAWARLGGGLTLKIIGSGPAETLRDRGVPGVEWLGRQSRDAVLACMRDAAFLVFPSVCYENLPLTIVEAFATGLPVVASRLGGTAEVVDDERTGLHFAAGDAADLATTLARAFADPHGLAEMGRAARREYERAYTADGNHAALMAIYERAARRARDRC